jgi:hypothetical protein
MPLADEGPSEDATPDDAIPEEDPAAIDRAFAELVAGYHLTAQRPDPPTQPVEPALTSPPPPVEPTPPPAPEAERFVPPPIEPLPRPGLPAVLGWIGIGYAIVFVLLTAVGMRLPAIAGWLAILGFIGSFVILIIRLPRSRPPDDGARL